jgi:hypothetical protein
LACRRRFTDFSLPCAAQVGASREISEHVVMSALISAVQTPKSPSEHHHHQQAAGSERQNVGNATDVELADVTHIQKKVNKTTANGMSLLSGAGTVDGSGLGL